MEKLNTGPGSGVEISQENKRLTSEDERQIHGKIKAVGEKLCPQGVEMTGFALVYYYRPKTEVVNKDSYAFMSLSNVGKMPEPVASLGVKKLAEHCMTKFGRTPPKERH